MLATLCGGLERAGGTRAAHDGDGGVALVPLDALAAHAGILALAAVTVAVDVATAWADIPLAYLGRVPVSPALPLGIAAGAHARAAAGRPRPRQPRGVARVPHHRRRRDGASASTSTPQHPDGLADALGLVVGALGEELVYRLAVLMLVGACMARLLAAQLAQRRGLGRGARHHRARSRRGSCSCCSPATSRR